MDIPAQTMTVPTTDAPAISTCRAVQFGGKHTHRTQIAAQVSAPASDCVRSSRLPKHLAPAAHVSISRHLMAKIAPELAPIYMTVSEVVIGLSPELDLSRSSFLACGSVRSRVDTVRTVPSAVPEVVATTALPQDIQQNPPPRYNTRLAGAISVYPSERVEAGVCKFQ